MEKIVSAGTLCLDITPVFQNEHSIEQLFLPGKLVNIGGAAMSPGGSAANTGLACSRFGAQVSLMAKVGCDPFGKMLQDIIEKHPVENCVKAFSACDTSYTIVIAPPSVDRIFLHCPGANDNFGIADIDFSRIEEANLFHFGYPTIMKRLYQNPDELIDIYRKAKALNTLTSLDLTTVEEGSEAASQDWRQVFQDIIPFVDYFVPSVEELCFLIDRPRYADWMRRAKGGDITSVLNWQEDIRPLADQLLEWGAKVILIKCGAPGIYLRTGSKAPSGWESLELFERSYQPDCFRSATGAGDVSIAAFLTAILKGFPPERCLQLAAGAGACCVSSYDALSGLLSLDEIARKIDHGWKKLPLKKEKLPM